MRFAEAVTAPEAPMRVSMPGASTDPSSPMRAADPSIGYHIAGHPVAVPAFPDVYEGPTVDSAPVHSYTVEDPWAFPWRLAVTSVACVAAMLIAWGVLVFG